MSKFTNAQFDRAMRKTDDTPAFSSGASSEGSGDLLKNFQSSSLVVSEGTFPAHITHSDLWGGGLGWYGWRTGSLPAPWGGDDWTSGSDFGGDDFWGGDAGAVDCD